MELRYEKPGFSMEIFDFYQPVTNIMDAEEKIGFIMQRIGMWKILWTCLLFYAEFSAFWGSLVNYNDK